MWQSLWRLRFTISPEGISVSVPIFYATGNRRKAFLYSALSGVAEPIGAGIGYLCQNLYLASTALDAGACAIAAYDQEACDRLLGADGKEEFTIYISSVGKT